MDFSDLSSITLEGLFKMADDGIITYQHIRDIILPMAPMVDGLLHLLAPHHPAVKTAVQALPIAK